MESRVSRLERYKDSKKHKRIKIMQIVVILLMIALLIGGIYTVDLTVEESLLLQDQQVFRFEATDEHYTVHLFGKDYPIQRAVIDGTYSRIIDGIGKVKTEVKQLMTQVIEH